MINFCTLFDSYYLDKGIALYRSLERVSENFTLYIFCFDDRSREILNSMNLKHAVILHHSMFENEELLKLKGERSKAEYCWTCTPVIIEYVLDYYKVDSCTYIDADLFFFNDPQILFDEIAEYNANVVITPHRFTNSLKDQRLCKRSGKYCVEFNYFDQTPNARKALTWWKERCAEWCFHLYEPERMGDQKYIEKFPILFDGVHELQHLGGGVAPWNLRQYVYDSAIDGKIYFKEKKSGKKFPVVFYHFQNLRYLTEECVNASSETHSKKTKDALYIPYLKEVEKCRNELKRYGVSFSVKKTYSSNPVISFLQGNILRYKVKSLSDIYNLKKLI